MITSEMVVFALCTCGALALMLGFVSIVWPLLMGIRQRRVISAAFNQRVALQEERIARREHWTHPPLRKRLDFDLRDQAYDDPYGHAYERPYERSYEPYAQDYQFEGAS